MSALVIPPARRKVFGDVIRHAVIECGGYFRLRNPRLQERIVMRLRVLQAQLLGTLQKVGTVHA